MRTRGYLFLCFNFSILGVFFFISFRCVLDYLRVFPFLPILHTTAPLPMLGNALQCISCSFCSPPLPSLFLTDQRVTFGAPDPTGLSDEQLYISTWAPPPQTYCSGALDHISNSPVFWLNAIQWAGVCAPRTLLALSSSLYIYRIFISALSPSLSPPTLPPVPSLYLSVSPSRSVCISLHPSVSPSSSPSLIRVQIGFSNCDLFNACLSFLL